MNEPLRNTKRSLLADSPMELDRGGVLASLKTFFFEPTTAHTLAAIRIATGLMLAYIHLVWLVGSADFFGEHALIGTELWQAIHRTIDGGDWKWSYLNLTDSLTAARTHELAALTVSLAMAVGLFTRTSVTLAWFLTLMTTHRLTGYLFGLDQIVLMLSLYLIFSQCGRVASLDRLIAAKLFNSPQIAGTVGTPLAKRNGRKAIRIFQCLSGWHGTSSNPDIASWKNQTATRLIQIHLCIIYLFGGLGKLRGEMWWDGTAMWYSAAAYDYQSLDLTWIGNYPVFGAMLTHMTVFWEVSYGAIVWPRWLRPWTLLTAFMVHGGIAIFMGMITFGTMMIVANFAFVSPELTRRIFLDGRRLIAPKA